MIWALVRWISGVWIVQLLASLDARLGGQVGHALEGLDVLGPAVGVAAVVERVDADEDVAGLQRLGPGQGEREEDRVAGGHVGDRDPVVQVLGPIAVGTAMSAVRAEPPNRRRSMSTTTCRATPRAAATRAAASSSTWWRWPYRKLRA